MMLLPLAGLVAVQLQATPATLTHLLRAARANNQTLGISRAQLEEQEAAVQQAFAVLAPTLQASGSYTRNQYAASFTVPESLLGIGPPTKTTSLTIQPYNAWSGTVGLNVPLFSAANLYRYAEAKRAKVAFEQGALATDAEVLLSTARAYYQVVGSQGVVDAAQEALGTANDNLRIVRVKLSAGTETRVAVDRAQVDVARSQQTLVSAQQTLAVAVRNLETLTGEALPDRLPPPEPAETLTQSESDYVAAAEQKRPEVLQAREALAQQEVVLKEAWAQLAPSLVGTAQEHFTNAPGFVPADAYWAVGVNLAWTVDPLGTHAAVRRAEAGQDELQHRLRQAQDTVRDDVHSAWLQVNADRAQLEEADSERLSAKDALEVTRTQFTVGASTSLDLSQSQRDAFNAEATFAQVEADLAAALLALHKAAGEPLLSEGGRP